MKRRFRWLVGLTAVWLWWSSGAAIAQVCGNGSVEAPEECDDGGLCVGSSNAGAACQADSDCAGGRCRAVGGDGCAANCTRERDVVFELVPGETIGSGLGASLKAGTSGIVAEAAAISGVSVAIPMEGTLTLTLGKERDGIIPVVIKENGVNVPAIEVSLLGFSGCGCVKGSAAKTCGGTFLEADNTPSLDCRENANVCDGRKPCAFVHGPGNTLSGVIGCSGLDGTDLEFVVDAGGDTGTSLPPRIAFSGTGGPGAAQLFATIGLDIRLNGGCTGTGPAYGPDGVFCTPDDRPDLSIVATNPAVTGTASASVVNLPDGSSFGPITGQGAPFSCEKLVSGNPGGAHLVSAFAVPNLDPLGAVGVTINLVAKESVAAPTCAGDCGGDGEVTVEEIVRMVNIALGAASVDQCNAGDQNGDGEITIEEIVAAVNKALSGC
ncbi:MAG: hypothetical protein KatS3mg077_2732 [Candidatus Binatia bacterium]|nr:MAG: hypothetical protein KatS3mg077_2732 [Candidatus Binatia bacterium]